MSQEQQPEALRLACFFESMKKSSHRWYDGTPVHEKAATELRSLHARVLELEASLQDALSQMENDWERIDGEWGPCGLTLEQAVENGKHGTKAIKSARKALRHGITQEKQG